MPVSAEAPSMLRAGLLAAGVRAAYLALASVLGLILSDYDSSASLSMHTCMPAPGNDQHQYGTSMRPVRAEHGIWDWVVWDSVFFLDIACAGYQYEQQYAFFPLFPALMRTLRSTTGLPLPASGLLISFACCVLSTVLLLQLSIAVTQDVQLSVLSSLLFLLSPASIFHAAMYTESLFTALTFTGLWLLHTYEPGRSAADGKAACGWKAEILWHARFWGAACAFALASCTRSNGIISAGFLLHAALSRALQQHVQHSKTSQLQSTSSLMHLSKAACTVLGYSACGILASALVALPLLAHQQHAYSAFCSTSSSSPSSTKGLMNRVLMTAGSGLWQPSTLQAVQPSTQQAVQPRPWCGKGGVYNFVQQQYWGVGLLKYWQLSQVPNFLLAAPVLLVSIAGCWAYAQRNARHMALGGLSHISSSTAATTGSTAARPGSTVTASPASSKRHQRDGSVRLYATGFFSPRVAVFIYPWAFMAACALLIMHVQVATRFLSSCPALYWFLAHLRLHGGASTLRSSQTNSAAQPRKKPSLCFSSAAVWVWGWCFTYMAAGALLFPNFYPWT